jgi:hypothetical protein
MFDTPFFQIEHRNNCSKPEYYPITTRATINGATFIALSVSNFCLQTFLVVVILFNWKAVFHKDFVYKLILTMNSIACLNSVAHFSMTIPCTLTGCLSYSVELIQFFTCLWETCEFGFFWAVFFIAIDRFFTFFFQKWNWIVRKVS